MAVDWQSLRSDVDARLQQIESRGLPRLVDLPDPVRRGEAVIAAIEAVDQYFARVTSPQNARAWAEVIDARRLREAIESEASPSVRGREATELQRRLTDLAPGFELTVLRKLRRATDRYVAAIRYGDPQRAEKLIPRQLQAVSALIDPDAADFDQVDSSQRAARVSLLLQQLDGSNQIPGLQQRFTGLHRSPNLIVTVDQSALTLVVDRGVDQTDPLRRCLLGTYLVGTTRLTGRVTGNFLPSEGTVAILLRLDANMVTSNRGYNKPVTIDSTGRGNVYTARQLAITPRRVVAGPVVATATFDSTIRRINHPLRIVRRIAGKQAAKVAPRAEEIARQNLEDQVRGMFQEQSDVVAQRTFPDADARLRPFAQRLDLPIPTRSIGSTSTSASWRMTLAGKDQWAAAGPPPTGVIPGASSVTLQVHQSVANNLFSRVLSSLTLTQPKVRATLRSLGIEPGSLRRPGQDEAESFEVDFESTRPLFVQFNRGVVEVGLRADRFATGDRELRQSLQVVARYRPGQLGGRRWVLIRDRQLDITFPGSRRLSVTQAAVKANVLERLETLFPKLLLDRVFRIPTTLQLPALAGRGVRIDRLEPAGEWVTVGLSLGN